MFDWSDTVFRRRNVTRRRISNIVLQPRYWGSEADSPEVCRLHHVGNDIAIWLHWLSENKRFRNHRWYSDTTRWEMGECCPFENFYICKLIVIGEDGDTTCAFSRGCCKVNGTAVKAVSGGLPHSRKYDFLNIVKINIPLRCKENIINFYFYYFNCWFTRSDSEKYWKIPIGLRACPTWQIIVLFRE